MLLAWLEVNSVKRLLEQSEMYQDRNATSNTSTPPTPQGLITPLTVAKGFHPIGGTPLVLPATQSTKVSHTQALNLLESQVAMETIVWKLTPVNLVDQSMAQPSSSTPWHKNSLLHWLVLHPLHGLGWIQWSIHLLVRCHPGSACMGAPLTNHKCSKHI